MRETLRKFALEDCELATMIWNISIFLRCLTINIDSRNTKEIPFICYIITLLLIVSYLYVYFFNMIWFVLIRCPETGDRVAAMIILSLSASAVVGIIKLIYMILYSDEVRRMIDNYFECDAHVIPGSRFSNNMLKTLRIVKRRAIVYWVLIMSNAFVYNLSPIFMSGRHLSEDYLVIYGLEPMLESPNFEIATTLSSSCVFLVCFTVATISSFFMILVGYIEAQILSLSEEIKQVWIDAIADKRERKAYKHLKNEPLKIVNKYVKHRLINIIEKYNTNINLLHDVEHIFRDPIGIGFVCLSLAIIAEFLGGLENTYLQLPFALVQISMDCFIGQRLMDASIVFEEAVYICEWEKFDNLNMKIILMMLHASQKTMKVSAGGIATLNFICVMSVLRSIRSTYTALRPFIKKSGN